MDKRYVSPMDGDIFHREKSKKIPSKFDSETRHFRVRVEDGVKKLYCKDELRKEYLRKKMEMCGNRMAYVVRDTASKHRSHHHRRGSDERRHKERQHRSRPNRSEASAKKQSPSANSNTESLNMRRKFGVDIKHCFEGFKNAFRTAFSDLFSPPERNKMSNEVQKGKVQAPKQPVRESKEKRRDKEQKTTRSRSAREHRREPIINKEKYRPENRSVNDTIVAFIEPEYHRNKLKRRPKLTRHTLPLIVVSSQECEEKIEKKKKSSRHLKYYNEFDLNNCHSDCFKRYDVFSDCEEDYGDYGLLVKKNDSPDKKIKKKQRTEQRVLVKDSIVNLYNKHNFMEFSEDRPLYDMNSKDDKQTNTIQTTEEFITVVKRSSSKFATNRKGFGFCNIEEFLAFDFTPKSFEPHTGKPKEEDEKLKDKDTNTEEVLYGTDREEVSKVETVEEETRKSDRPFVNLKLSLFEMTQEKKEVEEKTVIEEITVTLAAGTLLKDEDKPVIKEESILEKKQLENQITSNNLTEKPPVKPEVIPKTPDSERKARKKSPSHIPRRIHEPFTEKVTQITRDSRLPVFIKTPRRTNTAAANKTERNTVKLNSEKPAKVKNKKSNIQIITSYFSPKKKDSHTSAESKTAKDQISTFEKRKLYGQRLRTTKRKGVPPFRQTVEVRFFMLENGICWGGDKTELNNIDGPEKDLKSSLERKSNDSGFASETKLSIRSFFKQTKMRALFKRKVPSFTEQKTRGDVANNCTLSEQSKKSGRSQQKLLNLLTFGCLLRGSHI